MFIALSAKILYITPPGVDCDIYEQIVVAMALNIGVNLIGVLDVKPTCVALLLESLL